MPDEQPEIGTILWQDLTAQNADELRDFYAHVVGWHPEPVNMGNYDDYQMVSPTSGEPVAGICHQEGPNVGLPTQWLIYFSVANIEQSIAQVIERGGEVLVAPTALGDEIFCVIRDPAGAVCALTGPG